MSIFGKRKCIRLICSYLLASSRGIYLCVTCTQRVHNVYTTYTQRIHNVYTSYLLKPPCFLPRYLSVHRACIRLICSYLCTQRVHNVYTTCTQRVHNVYTTCIRLILLIILVRSRGTTQSHRWASVWIWGCTRATVAFASLTPPSSAKIPHFWSERERERERERQKHCLSVLSACCTRTERDPQRCKYRDRDKERATCLQVFPRATLQSYHAQRSCSLNAH
jgi:hypothetical protein